MENTGFKFESRIFYFIDLQNEEDYERKESSIPRDHQSERQRINFI